MPGSRSLFLCYGVSCPFFPVKMPRAASRPIRSSRALSKISITETGTIQPKEKIIVKNEVEGSTTIAYLVDEGTKVKKGDLMMELDSSTLSDKKVDQEISVQNAEASRIDASENYEVAKNQAQSDIESAKLTYDFAQQDLKKYIEGEYPDSAEGGRVQYYGG